MDISRRGFLRAAMIGGAGAATVAACPDIVYFFMGGGREILSIEDINSLTMRYIVPTLADHIFRPSPFFLKARQMGMSTLSRAMMEYRINFEPETKIFVPESVVQHLHGGGNFE